MCGTGRQFDLRQRTLDSGPLPVQKVVVPLTEVFSLAAHDAKRCGGSAIIPDLRGWGKYVAEKGEAVHARGFMRTVVQL